ncbi:dmX-like protein [Pimephales promelas]|nr:dmX-like protein [Pimephales promelas]
MRPWVLSAAGEAYGKASQCSSFTSAASTHFIKFSPDGEFFATAGQDDCLVKVWYSTSKWQADATKLFTPLDLRSEINFSFIYLAHPRSVTGFSWRKTSKHMPRGVVCNVLLTCCKDSVCRLWAETLLPSDCLLSGLRHNQCNNDKTNNMKKSSSSTLSQSPMELNLKPSWREEVRSLSQLSYTGPLPQQQNKHYSHRANITHANALCHFHIAASINPATGNMTSVMLTDTHMTSAMLTDTHMTSVMLTDTHMTSAMLTDTHMTSAMLTDTHMTSAMLTDTHMTSAMLTDTHMTSAMLTDTHMTSAMLTDTHMTSAMLTDTHMTSAMLTDTHMTSHDLSDADRHPHDLSDALGISLYIPLLPSISAMSGADEEEPGGSFTVHWLNNKELHLTLSMEVFLQQLRSRDEQSGPADTHGTVPEYVKM